MLDRPPRARTKIRRARDPEVAMTVTAADRNERPDVQVDNLVIENKMSATDNNYIYHDALASREEYINRPR